jgi:hypothetical protein
MEIAVASSVPSTVATILTRSRSASIALTSFDPRSVGSAAASAKARDLS